MSELFVRPFYHSVGRGTNNFHPNAWFSRFSSLLSAKALVASARHFETSAKPSILVIWMQMLQVDVEAGATSKHGAMGLGLHGWKLYRSTCM